ncbi:META domain-containing protein [Isoptericola halotolerans]|uniref:Heat shock protein HslJ n=1 Tax=Isoptericola halotolerans TaxID=300560 RepID=A0ABX2A8C3_9MICO|nr:heat shock protein HslJ [Isoptericola halotolerans]
MRSTHLTWPPVALAAAVVATALAACGTTGAQDVAGRTFVAVEVTGHELAAGSQVVVAFTEDSVGLQPGCNSMSAPATWEDGTLRLTGEMRSTMMACSDELMAQDQWFSDLVASGPALAFDGDNLRLTGQDVTVVLVEHD